MENLEKQAINNTWRGCKIKKGDWTSLVVKGLKLHVSTSGATGSTLWVTKILHPASVTLPPPQKGSD